MVSLSLVRIAAGETAPGHAEGQRPISPTGDDAASHVAGSTLWLVATSAGFPATAEDRLRNIQAITDAALAHLDVEDLLDELLDRVREILEVDTAAVLLIPPGSNSWRPRQRP